MVEEEVEESCEVEVVEEAEEVSSSIIKSAIVSPMPIPPEGNSKGELEFSSGSSPFRDLRAFRMREAKWERERERCRGSIVEVDGESGEGRATEGRERRIDS